VCLSGLVAIFVLALAFLTFTQLPADGSQLQRWLERIAYLIAVGASIACFVIDPQSCGMFVVAGVSIGIVAYLGINLYNRPRITQWLTGPKAAVDPQTPCPPNGESPATGDEHEPLHPHEVGPRIPFIGNHLLAWECTSRINRIALSIIAVTAFLAAVSGWGYDHATAYADSAASGAMEQEVLAFKHLSLRQSAVHYVWGPEARMHESRLRLKAAQQRAELAHRGLFGLSEQPELDQMAWQKNLLLNHPDESKTLDGERGPEQDPYYPEKELEQATRKDPEAAFAEWDAENELRQAWHLKAARYLLTLTMFAIALYLLGQSMGMGLGREAFILVLGGLLIAGFGAFCELTAAAKRLPHNGEAASNAAENYGIGRTLYAMAHEADEYKEAAKQFHSAIAARPSFALAHYYYAESLYNADRIHPDEADSLPSRKSGILATSVKEMKTSLDEFRKQGSTLPEELVGNYGFYTLLQAVSLGNVSILKQGITVLKQGLDSYPKDTWLELNLAVALLASGKTVDAKKYYDRSFADGVRPEVAIAAIGDLEIVRQYCAVFYRKDCEALDSEISRLKSRLVITAGPEPKGAHWNTSHPSMSRPTLAISPAFLSWKASINMKENRDVLLVIWYFKDTEWGAWRVLNSVSGLRKISELENDRGEDKSLSLSYLHTTHQHRCLDRGDYRAEFYLNGHLAAEQSVSLKMAHEFKGVGIHDINLEACYPTGWSDWQYESPDVTGPDLVRGSANPDEKRAVYLFSYYYPRSGTQAASFIEQSIARSQKILEPYGLPPNLTFKSEPEPCGSYPVAHSTQDALWYEDSTRVATVRAWVAGDGIVYVGMALNDARNGLDADDCMLLTSLSNIYAPFRRPTPVSNPAAPQR
jgi:tetratricopeptide (TPR) repeat protein